MRDHGHAQQGVGTESGCHFDFEERKRYSSLRFSHCRKVSGYNITSTFSTIFADKIGGREK